MPGSCEQFRWDYVAPGVWMSYSRVCYRSGYEACGSSEPRRPVRQLERIHEEDRSSMAVIRSRFHTEQMSTNCVMQPVLVL
jgi:hypothetical protein